MNTELINLAKEVGFNPLLIFIILLLMPILLRIENFIQSYDNIKSRKLNKIQQAIDCTEMPELEIKRLTEIKVNELYYQATGLNIDSQIRSYVINLMNQLSINEKQINSIRYYLAKTQDGFQVNISKLEWCFLCICKWIAIIFTYITIMTILLIILKILNFHKYEIKSTLGLLFVCIAVLIAYTAEARKYYLIQKIYKSHSYIFTTIEPNKILKLGFAILFIFMIFLLLYLRSIIL